MNRCAQTVAQRLQRHESEIAGQEDHVRPLGPGDQRRAQLRSHSGSVQPGERGLVLRLGERQVVRFHASLQIQARRGP